MKLARMPDEERNQTFQSKALWQRALIVFAGPAVNFLLAIVIFIGLPSGLWAMRQRRRLSIRSRRAAPPQRRGYAARVTASSRFNGTEIDSFNELVNEIIMYPE